MSVVSLSLSLSLSFILFLTLSRAIVWKTDARTDRSLARRAKIGGRLLSRSWLSFISRLETVGFFGDNATEWHGYSLFASFRQMMGLWRGRWSLAWTRLVARRRSMYSLNWWFIIARNTEDTWKSYCQNVFVSISNKEGLSRGLLRERNRKFSQVDRIKMSYGILPIWLLGIRF